MNYIFFGLLLTFLNFNITIGENVVGILPDFIGFIMITLGLKELSEESGFFTKTIPFAIGMAGYSALLYVLDLFVISGNLSWITALLGIAATLVGLYISYSIIQGIFDMERKYNTDLRGDTLFRIWKPLAILKILSYVTLFVPMFTVIFIVATFILTVLFLADFYTAKNNYMRLSS